MRVQVNTIDGVYDYGLYGVCRAIAKDSKGRIWIAYHENDNIGITGPGLYAAYSGDGGVTWTEELAVDDEDFDGSSPGISLLIDSNDIPHILYVSDTVSSGRIYHTSRAGGIWLGATGGKAACNTVFTNDPGAARHLYGMAACIDSQDNIHLVASDSWGASGKHGTFYFKYTAATNTWGSEVTILLTGAARACQIVVDSSGNPHVLRTGGLLMHHSSDGGATWSSYDTDLYSKASGVNMGCADLAIDSNDNFHIAYRDDSVADPEEIRYITGMAENWGTPVTIATAIETIAVGDYWYGPAIVLDSRGNIYVTYQLDYASVTSDDGVYYVRVVGGVAGSQQTLVSSDDITYPGTGGYQMPSIIAGLWQKYPSRSVLPAPVCPTAVLLDVNGQWGAKVMFVSPSISLKGNPNIDQLIYQHIERMER